MYMLTKASLVAQMIKNLPTMQETQVWSLGQERSSGEENGYLLQYSCLENPMDRGAWRASPWGHKELDTAEHTIYINRSHYLWVVILGHSFSNFSLSVIFHIIYI